MRAASISQSFAVARQKTAEATQRILVETAKREHARVMAADPRPARFTRTVDGREGAPEASVKPAGVINYTYPRLELVVQYALEVLFDLSPVLSGEYRNSHTIFVGGRAVRNLAGWDGTGEITISNSVPYARKIELGVMTMRVPGTTQIYTKAVNRVLKRFGNVAGIYFEWVPLAGGGIASGRAGNKSDLRFPAMVITER